MVGDYVERESLIGDLVVRGFIKFIGNYEACIEKFSEFSTAEMSHKKPVIINNYFTANPK